MSNFVCFHAEELSLYELEVNFLYVEEAYKIGESNKVNFDVLIPAKICGDNLGLIYTV